MRDLLKFSQPSIMVPWEFYDENIQRYGPYSFGVDIPKVYVYICETFADRNYDVIRMTVKKTNVCSFGPLLNRNSILYLFDYLIFQVLVDIIIFE